MRPCDTAGDVELSLSNREFSCICRASGQRLCKSTCRACKGAQSVFPVVTFDQTGPKETVDDVNRLGSSVQLSEKKGDSVVYQLDQKVNTAYVDRELGKSAVYVNTDKPLKIKKIDYTKWKQMEEVELGFDKVDKE